MILNAKSLSNATWHSLWLTVLLLCFTVKAVFPQAKIAQAKYVVSFHVTERGFILIDAKFGKETDGTFLLDSGSSAGLFLDRDASLAAGLKIVPGKALQIQGASPGVVASLGWSKVKVRQNKTTFVDGVWPITDYTYLSKILGVPLAGVLGSDILSRYVVKIDYAAGQLSFFGPRDFHYEGNGTALALEPSGDTGLFIVKADIKFPDCSTMPMRLFLDTGADPDVTFNPRFLQIHPDFGVRDSGLRVGLGLPMSGGSWGDLQSVMIGRFSLMAPRALARRKDSAELLNQFSDGSIDAGILSQFTIIFDKPQGQIIFEPRVDKPPVLAKPCVAPESKP